MGDERELQNGVNPSASPTPDSVGSDLRPSYVVGIGASAGGLESLEAFFDNMPADSGVAFVVVQHLSPDFKSLMSEILARHSSMTIVRVEDGVPITRDTIFLLQPKHNITVRDGHLWTTKLAPDGRLNLPIDIFFSSLARDCTSRAIAVVMSGTGSDGSRGVDVIHEHGGLVIVQDLESAAFSPMPRAALATGHVDLVCSPAMMPQKILQFVQDPEGFLRGQTLVANGGSEDELQRLFQLFRKRFGIDFSLYKSGTISRRIERRLQLSSVPCLGDYLKRLEDDSAELDILYRDMLVEVTYFFRDPKAFEKIEQAVITPLVSNREPDDEIRIWIAGCATGEEAYTYAMLLHDAMLRTSKNFSFKVFASDVHERSMEIASEAIYSAKSLERVPEGFREKYFVPHGEQFRIVPEVRHRVVFTRHNLTTDPPFTRIDLISCRNVLIYLDPEVQRRVMAMFHFGMRIGGTLVLGPSETVGPLSREFEAIDQTWRIYRKIRDVRLSLSNQLPIVPSLLSRSVETGVAGKAGIRGDEAWLIPSAYDELLSKYVPPSLLVNEFCELIHSFGDARRLLIQPTGRPTLDVSRMVEGELRSAITSAVHRASQQVVTVQLRSVMAETPNGVKRIDVTVEPFIKGNRKLFLVALCEQEGPPPLANTPSEFPQDNTVRVDELERELDHTRQSLQSTVEELETSNEELQSINEELIAANEELQSTNEELHSVNEELYTVNSEYQRKIDQLTAMTNDLNNLLKSTEIGTVFLDSDFRIRKYTPAIAAAFHVMEHDVGRPIEHISYNFDNVDLMGDLQQVRDSGQLIEREVTARDGRAFLKRIRPYVTESGQSDGLVLTFDEITAVKRAAQKAEVAQENLVISQNELQEFAYAVSHDLQAPLRHIQYFAQQFAAASEKDENALECVANIDRAATRMRDMIDSLLAYSRVATRGEDFADVHLDRVMDRAMEELRDLISERQAQITFVELPRIRGDTDQLCDCFRHLLQNAILYCDAAPPVIHVGVEKRESGWLLSFHDNGIGIDRRQYERIFVIFQRLGIKDTNHHGTGLGLALCRRIVERHGGWMWVESSPGRGSTFFVEFPFRLP